MTFESGERDAASGERENARNSYQQMSRLPPAASPLAGVVIAARSFAVCAAQDKVATVCAAQDKVGAR
jgi:hypothetical protein